MANLIDSIINLTYDKIKDDLESEETNKKDITISEKINKVKETIMSKKITTVTVSQIAKELVEKNKDVQGLNVEVAQKIINELFGLIKDHVANGERVSIVRFGNFEPRLQQGREGINNITKKPFKSPSKYVPKFEASDKFKEQVAATLKPE